MFLSPKSQARLKSSFPSDLPEEGTDSPFSCSYLPFYLLAGNFYLSLSLLPWLLCTYRFAYTAGLPALTILLQLTLSSWKPSILIPIKSLFQALRTIRLDFSKSYTLTLSYSSVIIKSQNGFFNYT